MAEHRMIGGSHERPSGPECKCGAEWDYWNDACTSVAALDTKSEEEKP